MPPTGRRCSRACICDGPKRSGFSTQIVDESPAEEAGLKSITFFVRGRNAYGMLESERGVHRLVRLSPFDAAHRRHTSFAAVDVIPEIEAGDDVGVEIKPDDLRVETFKSGGAGGQYVNKTESAVRIIHVPTGIIVASQQERSQAQNRDVAMSILRAKLVARAAEERERKLDDLRGERQANEWGSQIRSYVLQPYQLVKDHRTDVETGNVAERARRRHRHVHLAVSAAAPRAGARNSACATGFSGWGASLYAALFTWLGRVEICGAPQPRRLRHFCADGRERIRMFLQSDRGQPLGLSLLADPVSASGSRSRWSRSPLTLIALQAAAGALVAPPIYGLVLRSAATSPPRGSPRSSRGSIRRWPD